MRELYSAKTLEEVRLALLKLQKKELKKDPDYIPVSKLPIDILDIRK